MTSKYLYERAKKVLPGGVNSPVRAFHPYPFFIDSGDGSRIYDVEGNEYVDYCLGYGPLILGHKHPEVVRAIQNQLKKGIHFGIPNEAETGLAEKIVYHVPCAEMVRFVNSGTEATMNAIRLARAYTGREKVLMFDGAYHGAHDHLLFEVGKRKSPGIPEALADSTLVAPYNHLQEAEKILEENEIAAIIVEPVLGNIGCIPPRKGFLEGLRRICNDHKALLIFDEVITGFRLAMGGAQEYFNVTPDLVTLGKVIGGGFPIGAFAGSEKIMGAIKPAGEVFHAGTFCGHPFAMAAGLATIKVMEEEEIIEGASKFAKTLAKTLQAEIGYRVHQIGPMLQVFFTRKEVTKADEVRKSSEELFRCFHRILLENGVFIPPSRFECWFVSGVHSSKDLSLTKMAIGKAASKIKELEVDQS